MIRNRFLALVTLTLLVAAFLRIWQLALYPPGPHYDEAAELLIARSVTFGGARFFPMVEAYQGREVLFYYMSVPFLALIQDSVFSLRVLSVFCNLLTIALSVALGRAMFGGRRGVVVGIVVGVLMTLSFPMLWMSRQAFRSSALPLMQALALLLLWRGLKAWDRGTSISTRESAFVGAHGRAPSDNLSHTESVGARHVVPFLKFSLSPTRHAALLLILGGLSAGAAVYTYNSSRLFPIWLLLGGIVLFACDRKNWRLRIRQGMCFFIPLTLSAAPMALYAIQRPDVFFGRLAEVTQTEQSVTLAQSIVLHLKMFFIDGDPYFRYNEPQRPYFTFPEGILLLLGIGFAAYRFTRRSHPPAQRAAYFLALLSPLMVIPSVISVGGMPPSHMRSLGMVPLIFILVALGAEWCIHRLTFAISNANRSAKPMEQAIVGTRHVVRVPIPNRHTKKSGFAFLTPLVIVTLLAGGVLVNALYLRWASRAELFYETDADLAAAARWLIDQQLPEGTPVYVAARDKGHPTVMIAPVPGITWLGTDSLFRPPLGKTGLSIFPHSAPPPDEWRDWLAPGAVDGLPLAPDGQPSFQAFSVSGDAPLPVSAPSVALNNAYLSFAGLQASTIAAGDSGSFTMAWQVITPPPFTDLTPLLTVEDENGALIYRGDIYMAGAENWRPGETLLQRMHVHIPPATPPGSYTLNLAWIERSTDTYVSYRTSRGAQGRVWAQIGTLDVTRPAAFPDSASLPIDIPQETLAAPGVHLLGWNSPPVSRRPGESLPLTFYWQASEPARSNFTAAIILRGENGDTLLWQGTPASADYPASQWAPNEVLAHQVPCVVPREQPSGNYTLLISTDRVEMTLGTVNIEGAVRVFEVPPVQNPLNVNFDDQILLYSASIEQNDAVLNMRIIWQALSMIHEDYKVFVHLVDANGVILAQQDAMPQANAYPTSRWLPAEFVTDTYDLPLYSTAAALRIGFYDPNTAIRLQVRNTTGNLPNDYFELDLKPPF